MKYQFIIFITVFFSIYTAANSYIFIRGWQALPSTAPVRIVYTLIFVLSALSFIIGEFVERSGLIENSRPISIAGSTWLAFILYTFLLLIAIDIIRVLNFFLKFLPDASVMAESRIPLKLMAGVVITVIIILIAGAVTASSPVITNVDIKVPNKKIKENSLNIIMASDIHLGNIIGRKKFKYLVDKINSLEPDIVLFPGDFFDETLAPVVKDNMGGLVESIRSKYGVYAVTGNHEYIGGVDAAVAFMEKHQIRVLRDEVIKINGSLLLAGREDRSINRFTDRKRKSIKELLSGIDPNLPVVLMDHQPSSIDDSVNNEVDLHISGHTHNGQLWPFNYITGAIFRVSCGYRLIGNTHVYVSRGYGTWGPPVRTTGRPEIVLIQIRFADK